MAADPPRKYRPLIFQIFNINKIFGRLSIRAKLIIAFCLFGVVPVAVVGVYGAVHSFRLLNAATQDRLKSGVASKAEEVARFLKEVEGDVVFLSQLPTLQALINLPPEIKQERSLLLSSLGQEFLSVSQSHNSFYQIRYINELGKEMVRAEFDGQHHYLVPPGRLQDKGDRYYFREAMATPPGTMYISPMDLNIERGVVEVPHKPVVRYAVSLRDAQEQPRGIVIANLYASQILDPILALREQRGEVSLVRSDGLYLSRSTGIRPIANAVGPGEPPFPTWLVSYSERLQPGQKAARPVPAEFLSKDFPSVAATTILSGQTGIVVQSGLKGRIAAFAPIFPNRDRHGEFWVVLHSYSKAEFLSSTRSLQVLVLVLGGVVLFMAVGTGVAAARHFTRPITELIRGAKAIAQEDFDRPIQIETNDELEDLSHQFNRMAIDLKQRTIQLREARERAERKAQETQALLQIQTEIMGLPSLPRILQLVVDKTREMLKADVVVLCLDEPGVGYRVGATSGAPEVLRQKPGTVLDMATCPKVTDPEASCPVVAHEIPLPTHIAVPMRSGNRVVSDLCVGYRTVRALNQDETELLSGLANLAAVAIDNARLQREVQALARLEEQERIAGDLHDGIIQSIYATGLSLEECVRLAEEDPQQILSIVETSIRNLNTVIRDVRNYIIGLQSEGLQAAGLSGSLADLAHGLSLNGLIDVQLDVEPDIDAVLTPEQTGHLFQICREALTNVVKHAGASKVLLTLARSDGQLRLRVEDDGRGCDLTRCSGSGHGLRTMEERAKRLGGVLRVEGTEGRGTRVTMEFPLKRGERLR
ncbi:MAG: HAMP domain-containing protein [Candidatus Methylomirabilis oxyfera]|nr:HAMP domain-containing protein [Candidatus Methylomirabilis oxyfera]